MSVLVVSFVCFLVYFFFFFFKQKTAYEMRISDWSSDVCSSDLPRPAIAVDPSEADPGRPWDQRRSTRIVGRPLFCAVLLHPRGAGRLEIGRASCRERVCQYV